jgi:hypothetical protein
VLVNLQVGQPTLASRFPGDSFNKSPALITVLSLLVDFVHSSRLKGDLRIRLSSSGDSGYTREPMEPREVIFGPERATIASHRTSRGGDSFACSGSGR